MPTYQYRCAEDHDIEVVQAFTDAALTKCPECGAPLRKVYGSVGVVFKGSGFYRNDSRDAKTTSTPAGAKSDAATSPKADSGAKSSSDSGGSSSSTTPATTTSSGSSSSSSSTSASGSAA